MNNCIILDIGRFPDENIIFVSPYHGSEPDTGVFFESYRTEDCGIWRSKTRRAGAFIHTHNTIAV
jgi:hypothetical protein